MSENTMLVPQMGINMEQATANCEELAKAIHEITAGVLTTVNSFCRWIQQVAAEVAAQQEMETALRWASVDNRPLYNRYRHTKKKRIDRSYCHTNPVRKLLLRQSCGSSQILDNRFHAPHSSNRKLTS